MTNETPTLEPYCADPTCSPSTPCKPCRDEATVPVCQVCADRGTVHLPEDDSSPFGDD